MVSLIRATEEAEANILFIARVSSDQSKTDTGLLKYLIRNKHWSPFEHAFMTVEITTSRAIAAQILRHRSFFFQEFSQRYAKAYRWVGYAGRSQASSNRQSSIDDLDEETQKWWGNAQYRVADFAFGLYREALDKGIAKECARFILPLSTETKLYMTGSLRSWIHYFDLRCDEHTQLEHREIADEIRNIFGQQFPIIAAALGELKSE